MLIDQDRIAVRIRDDEACRTRLVLEVGLLGDVESLVEAVLSQLPHVVERVERFRGF